MVETNDVILYIKNKLYKEQDFGTFGKFLKVDNYNQIIYPLYYINIIEPISKIEITDFNNYLSNCFKKLKELISQLKSNSGISNEIICKYWARAYTIESEFYSLMNKRLREKKGKMFIPFIKMMYEGIKNGVFTSIQNRNQTQTLYRGSKISNYELNKIRNYINNNNNNNNDRINRLKCILYIRPFLSFSEDQEISKYFMKKGFLKKGERRVLYVLTDNPSERDEISYAPIEKYSIYNEKEVLFFPYSCFVVTEIREINEILNSYVEIKLGYMGAYKRSLEAYYDYESDDIPNTEYEREISELGLISNNYKKYWKVVKEIKIEEGNVSCILYLGKGKLIFSVNNIIKFYDLCYDKTIQNINKHTDDIIDLFKFNDEKFISSSKDKTIKFFEYSFNDNFNLIRSLEIHEGQVNQVIKLSLSDCFISCSDDKTIKFWKFDFNERQYSHELTLIDDEDNICIYELKKEYLVSISRNGNLKFLSKQNEGWKKENLKILEYPLKNCFSFLDENIIILGTEKSLFLIDTNQKIIIKKFPHQYQASSIGYLKENLLLGLKEENNLCLLNEFSIEYDIDNINVECIGKGKDFCLEINQIQILDENTLVTANKNNYIKIWERSCKLPNIFMVNNKIKINNKDSDKNINININNYHKKEKNEYCRLIEKLKKERKINENDDYRNKYFKEIMFLKRGNEYMENLLEERKEDVKKLHREIKMKDMTIINLRKIVKKTKKKVKGNLLEKKEEEEEEEEKEEEEEEKEEEEEEKEKEIKIKIKKLFRDKFELINEMYEKKSNIKYILSKYPYDGYENDVKKGKIQINSRKDILDSLKYLTFKYLPDNYELGKNEHSQLKYCIMEYIYDILNEIKNKEEHIYY